MNKAIEVLQASINKHTANGTGADYIVSCAKAISMLQIFNSLEQDRKAQEEGDQMFKDLVTGLIGNPANTNV